MRHALLRVVLEAKKFVTGSGVNMGREFLLDALPTRHIGGILVTVLPDGPPRFQDGVGRSSADLVGGSQAVLENAANHKRVRFRIECVELRGYMRLGVNVSSCMTVIGVIAFGIGVRRVNQGIIVVGG